MSTTALKLTALFLMFLDHIYEFIGGAPIWLTWLGRISAPLFFFSMAWGFFYTHDRRKYMINMYFWGVGMAVGDIVVGLLVPNAKVTPFNNIFVTLLLVAMVVDIIENFKSKNTRYAGVLLSVLVASQVLTTIFSSVAMRHTDVAKNLILLPSALFPSLLNCEGSVLWVIIGVVIYFNRTSKKSLIIAYTILSLMWLVLMPVQFTYQSLFLESYQWIMIGALPFMLMYNGEKGRGYKWLFYIFYPAHIFVLCWLGSFISF